MARRCAVTKKGVLFGNNVSHANNKTRRRFMPNLRNTTLMSETLGRVIHMRLSARGIRSVEHMGGFDAFVMAAKESELPKEIRRLKKQIAEKLASSV